MRIVIQRVSSASVAVERVIHAEIARGLLILVGVETGDTEEDASWLCGKVVSLRIFGDGNGLMNLDVKETGGDILVVSQFTLHAAYKKGNRPSFIQAARPEQAIPLYEYFIAALSEKLGKPVATGIFGADMEVKLVNDGPVTIIMDSKSKS